MITGLLQFELLCRIITERTTPAFLWISGNAFLFEKNRRNAKACGIKSDFSVNNGAFQTGYEPKTFFAARILQSRVARPLAPGESRLDM